jgi:hypothetical protein
MMGARGEVSQRVAWTVGQVVWTVGWGGGTSGALDAGNCLIEPSDYNRSCSAAADCVTQAGVFPVQFGDFCQPDTCWCGGGTINRDAVAQYIGDVSKTPWGRDAS